LNNKEYPELSGVSSESELKQKITKWILNNSNEITVDETISPMTGELFVPYKYNYPDILRAWLEIHARAQKQENEKAMQLIEKIIEITITQEEKTGTLIKDNSKSKTN
jgi:hypothetical protein